ncbi:hypothetical protein [Phormidium sp. CCY1219]|uniref:hypothetical protein n=1 Tax=Phormidium sp. CCY1219 TaxID=2886104 RepID=UPI002D1EA0A3|nr:hypothetical protein [Phormidium sp. CCY1219]MEB3827488.1 hypothetical protein [Phormidium sp. CCY1219]
MMANTKKAIAFCTPLSAIALGILGAIATTTLLFGQSAVAQESNGADDLIEPQLENSRDPFDGTTGEGETFDVLDIIHRANLGGGRSMQEFRLEKEENINDAAAQFRMRQLELLRNQSEGIPVREATPAEAVTPADN